MNHKALSVGLLVAGLGLVLCSCGPPIPRDPSGRALFVPQHFRHGSGLPYSCYDADVNNQPMSYCFLMQDQCAIKMHGERKQVNAVIKSVECTPADEVYCFEKYTLLGPTGGWQSFVTCTRTPQQCESAKLNDVASGDYDPMNTSPCSKYDKSYQPRL
jgi:hypothetical protein